MPKTGIDLWELYMMLDYDVGELVPIQIPNYDR